MQSPRYNYRRQFDNLPELLACVEILLCSGDYILGRHVEQFEMEFARFCETRFALGVNSGTDALFVAMRALDIGPGDEVITQANTFHATVAAIDLAGARPVLVDATERSFLMDVSQVSSATSSKTRAIIPVHLYGKPVPMRELLAIADRVQALVIEDAAQAHGAMIEERRVGSFGVAGCFSFHPSKNLAAAGDAGAIVTNNSELAAKVKLQRALGQAGQNNHVLVGMNSKLDAIQACILLHKLKRLGDWNQARSTIAWAYRERLRDLPLSFQSHDPDELHVYHLFQVRSRGRDALLHYLCSQGIDAVVRYPVPIHLQPAFSKFGWRKGQFPVAEMLAKELLCLPIRPDMEMREVNYVTSQVRRFFETAYPRTLHNMATDRTMPGEQIRS